MKMNRRKFVGGSIATATMLHSPMVLGSGHGKPKVVVIGGGAGGATAARYIAKDGGEGVSVTLIEPTRHYYTCFFSNLYIGGFRTIDSIGHSYGKLASDYGVNVVHDFAVGVDRDAKSVSLASGDTVPYDKLVISPGIDFVEDSVPGWDLNAQQKMPHAYKAGSQTELLKAQLMAMPAGGTFVLVAPPNPFRCPPGPYERVSMAAYTLQKVNPTAKIIVLDPKEKFSKQGLFEQGWNDHYPGMIERIGPDFGGADVEVNPAEMTVTIDGSVEKVDVCNVIPAQKAGGIVHAAGVADGNWVPVNSNDMSTKADENIHVLGDAAAQGDMPKSGFSANSQAKVCANAILGALLDKRVFPPRYSNTCWSLISENDGIKVGATYEATDEKIATVEGFISQTDETSDVRLQTYKESLGWYDAITSDIFG